MTRPTVTSTWGTHIAAGGSPSGALSISDGPFSEKLSGGNRITAGASGRIRPTRPASVLDTRNPVVGPRAKPCISLGRLRASLTRPTGARRLARGQDRYLVDSASSHMLVSKIKPCMSKYKQLYGETANGSMGRSSSVCGGEGTPPSPRRCQTAGTAWLGRGRSAATGLALGVQRLDGSGLAGRPPSI